MIPHQMLRLLAVIVGVVLFLFGLWDLLVPRARFVSSNPSPGAVVKDVPSLVTVNFSNKLSSASRLNVTSTVKLLPSGESETLYGSSVVVNSQIDPGDPTGKSLRANLQPGLHKGIYWVNWTVKVSGWGTSSYGKTVFGVGMNVPDYLTRDMDGAVWERNYQYRERRAALIGGVVMLALGFALRVRR